MITVLVVDDDADLLSAYANLLEAQGYRVLLASSGAQALALARRERPEVLVSDIVMPVMDGFELIERMQAELGVTAPPAIVCSSFDITEDEALRRGARLFLSKPTDLETLARAVDSLLCQTLPWPESLAHQRQRAADERSRRRAASQSELRDLDAPETARRAQPWLDWLRVYLQCSGAGVLLLREGGLQPLVASGGFPSNGPATAFLRSNVATVVETRTSLVIGDARGHPSFRQTLAPGADIAFFAGVPLLTPVEVAVGALCVSDGGPRRFDAESLVLLEHLGRRGVSRLVAHRAPPGDGQATPEAPLLARTSFQVLLANELRIAQRTHKTLELAMLRLPPGVAPHACAAQLWREGAGPRTAIGAFAPEQITLFKCGAAREVSRLMSVCLDSLRGKGLLHAAGVVSVAGTTGLCDAPLVRLADNALRSATADGTSWKLRRIVVRPETVNA
jgi:CheY-like chemotaxis protein